VAAALGAALVLAVPVARSRGSEPLAATFVDDHPHPAHVVVVVMENHSYTQVIDSLSAPYVNSLREHAANFTNSHGVGHPSEPNYLGLFEGSTHGLTDDSCPHTYSSPNLASELIAAGRTFAGYSESMPSNGYTGCSSGRYARKHNPWVDYSNVPPAANLTFAEFPSDFSALPDVAFVVPNLCDDMHDCSVATGDTWLRDHVDAYVRWAADNDSLFVLTFDESMNPRTASRLCSSGRWSSRETTGSESTTTRCSASSKRWKACLRRRPRARHR
jgi:phosphatidylinositol-3-phosphatase